MTLIFVGLLVLAVIAHAARRLGATYRLRVASPLPETPPAMPPAARMQPTTRTPADDPPPAPSPGAENDASGIGYVLGTPRSGDVDRTAAAMAMMAGTGVCTAHSG